MPARLASLCATALLLLGGCFLQQLNQLVPPVPTVRNVEAQGVSLAGATLLTTLDVANPNGFVVVLTEVHALAQRTTRLAEVTLPYKVAIPARGHAPISLPLSISEATIQALLAAGADQVEAPLMVDADLRFTTPLGDSSVRLHWQQNLALPHAPRVTFSGVDVARLGTSDARLTVRLAIDNPNAFPLSCGAVDGRLLDEDRSLVTVQQKDCPGIAPSKVTEILIPVVVPALSITDLLGSRAAAVHLTATIMLGGHAFPVDGTAELR